MPDILTLQNVIIQFPIRKGVKDIMATKYGPPTPSDFEFLLERGVPDIYGQKIFLKSLSSDIIPLLVRVFKIFIWSFFTLHKQIVQT